MTALKIGQSVVVLDEPWSCGGRVSGFIGMTGTVVRVYGHDGWSDLSVDLENGERWMFHGAQVAPFGPSAVRALLHRLCGQAFNDALEAHRA